MQWTNVGPLRDVSTYRNTGAHVLRLRNGQIVSFHAYLHDHETFDRAIAGLVTAGIEEASAAPIVTPPGETPTTS